MLCQCAGYRISLGTVPWRRIARQFPCHYLCLCSSQTAKYWWHYRQHFAFCRNFALHVLSIPCPLSWGCGKMSKYLEDSQCHGRLSPPTGLSCCFHSDRGWHLLLFHPRVCSYLLWCCSWTQCLYHLSLISVLRRLLKFVFQRTSGPSLVYSRWASWTRCQTFYVA